MQTAILVSCVEMTISAIARSVVVGEVLVEPIGFEPMTLCLQSRCSTN